MLCLAGLLLTSTLLSDTWHFKKLKLKLNSSHSNLLHTSVMVLVVVAMAAVLGRRRRRAKFQRPSRPRWSVALFCLLYT